MSEIVALSPLIERRRVNDLSADLEAAGVQRGPMLALLIALYQSSSPKKRKAVLRALWRGHNGYPSDDSFSLALRMLGEKV